MTKGTLKDIGKYSAIGMEMVVCVLVGATIGYFIDKKIESIRPWSTMVFTLLGFLAGVKRLLTLSNNRGGKKGNDGRN
jgi:F0F1-type ATP synthase assembly protein I